MKGDAIHLPSATMKCDTPECGYAVEVGPRDVRKYVGAECPRCSAVMVTEATAQEVERALALIDLMNAAVGPVDQTGEGLRVSARVDTAGKVAEVNIRKAVS